MPEVALVGRSNVGKSSLINAIAGTSLARTSAAPGKTRLANFYEVPIGPKAIRLVDLPGYGYARGGTQAAEGFRKLTGEYFAVRRGLAGVLHLVDSRHPDLEQDAVAHAWLRSLGVRLLTVATKTDQLRQADRQRLKQRLQATYAADIAPVSAFDRTGLAELIAILRSWL
jgi:GTP-binding protein